MEIIEPKDINWEEESKKNGEFLAKAIDRINKRINEIEEKNNGILVKDMNKIVCEELGINLFDYDVNFMDIYIDHSQFTED